MMPPPFIPAARAVRAPDPHPPRKFSSFLYFKFVFRGGEAVGSDPVRKRRPRST